MLQKYPAAADVWAPTSGPQASQGAAIVKWPERRDGRDRREREGVGPGAGFRLKWQP